jgi:hypothetical protein
MYAIPSIILFIVYQIVIGIPWSSFFENLNYREIQNFPEIQIYENAFIFNADSEEKNALRSFQVKG